ncbi:MAG: prepilin-type N-terminal cleavage/methylation domain-containing protein [Candidatus Paceibacterota bacterium]|jgi:prepilin-type N-terminal cleavage/methylation domain-containing protein
MQNTQETTPSTTRATNKQIFALRKSAVSCQLSVVSCARNRAFSLLELLIVIAIMGVIAAAGAGFYNGMVKNVEIQSAGKALASDLRSMRSKAMMGALDDNGLSVKWGARVVNEGLGSPQYYVLYSTPTVYADANKLNVSTTTLPMGIKFDNPIDGAQFDIIFSRISGTTTSAQTITISSAQGTSQSVSVSTLGTIY